MAAAALAASAGDVPDSVRFPYLEVVEGGEVGTRYYLPYGQSTLGREASCTIALDEPRASRLHAEIAFDGAEFVLKDHKSRNGTFLNDKPVETAPLQVRRRDRHRRSEAGVRLCGQRRGGDGRRRRGGRMARHGGERAGLSRRS